MATKSLKLDLGALADPLDEQLERQGLVMDCTVLQRDADAVARLYVRGLLTDGETVKARARLFKSIQQAVRAAAATQS